MKKQAYIAIDCGYMSQLLRKASIQTIRKAYAAKGFDLVALLDHDFTPLGAAIDSPHRRAVSAVKAMYARASPRGIILAKRRSRPPSAHTHIVIDLLSAIRVASSLDFCKFLNADNVYDVRATSNCVAVRVDAEAG